MKNRTVMIGVSTRQNTTNLVPFLQLSGEKLILLETDLAKKMGWSKGIKRVIQGRKKTCDIIPIGSGTDLINLEALITKTVNNDLKSNPNQRIWWIFGGGQKLQQLAQFNHFTCRLDQGHDDMACYTEPQERSTYIISPLNSDNRKNLKNSAEPTDCWLDLDEILSVFDHTSRKGSCLWCRKSLEEGEIYGEEDLLTREQDQWFDDYEKRQAMFKFMLEKERSKQLKKISPKLPDQLFPIKFLKDMSRKSELGEYFERLMQTRITREVAACPKQHRINQVWANVRICGYEDKLEIAEYDLVLVTNFGTIIPMDAKSYDFAKKDEDARLHNLDKLSGVYTDFWSVFPYYQKDLDDQSTLQKEKEWNKLLRIPFVLEERKSKMLSVSEPDVDFFYVTETKKSKVQITQTEQAVKVNKEIKINTLSMLFNKLNLLRK